MQITDTITDATEGLVDGVIEAVPRFGVAVAVVVGTWVVARVVGSLVQPRLTGRRGEDFGRVMTKLLRWTIMTVGVLFALTVLLPSVKPVDLLAGAGVLSIAAGFAFQDILQNLLAGILILFRQPFAAGDQIEVDGHSGTVEKITIRETALTRFDGQRVLVPNADVYQNAVRVQTAHDAVRTSLIVGVDYDADLDHACDTALEALRSTEGVLEDPVPEALPVEFAASAINIDLRYWTDPRQASVRRVLGEVVKSVKAAYDREGIDIPFDIRTLDLRTSTATELRRASGASANGSALTQLTREQLYERAREADIEGRSQMTKAELARALRETS